MSAGTLTLTNNSDAVTGSGTAFTTDLTAGDFVVSVVGGVTYSLPVKTVTSNTALVLATPYHGPTQTKLAWSAVPFNTMNRVTAGMVTQATEALRGLNLDKQNWQSVFSAPGNITVELPDGSKYTGPSWLSVASQAGNLSALGIGGTGTALATLDWQTFDFVPGARYMVLSGNMTNVPSGMVVPGATYNTVINVTGYDGSTRHVEVWYSTSTAANYLHYEIRLAGVAGSKSFTVRQIWTSADVIPLANTALSTIGIGGYSTSISNFDWQTATFDQVGHYNVNCSNWLNSPPGLPTASLAMIEVVAVHNQEGANRRYVLRVSQIVQGSTRQMWDIVGYGLPNLRTWTVDSFLIFSSTAAGRQKLGFNDLGFGIQQPVTTNFDWQTTLMQSGQSWLLDASNMVNAPTELPNSGRLVAKVAGMSSAYAMLDVYEQPLSGAATGRRWYVYVGTYATAGSRGFTVRPLLTKADLDTRVGYALLAPAGNITTSQRVVLTNPFGMGTPVLCYIEIFVNNVWMSPGMIFNPSTGSFGTTASFKGDEGIIVQAGSYRIGCDPLSGGSNGGSAGIGLNNTTTAPYRVHVFKVTA